MNTFDSKTISAMRTVLDEVCSHIPANATAARAFIASRILEADAMVKKPTTAFSLQAGGQCWISLRASTW